jgi:glyoxylase I family protein
MREEPAYCGSLMGNDHIYISVSDLKITEHFYDSVLMDILGFRKNTFELNNDSHIQYFNKHFGYVIRPAKFSEKRTNSIPGLHHFCLRVESITDVKETYKQLMQLGIKATEAKNYPEYANDYWATFFTDLDGTQLEVTNYRQERKERFQKWEIIG